VVRADAGGNGEAPVRDSKLVRATVVVLVLVLAGCAAGRADREVAQSVPLIDPERLLGHVRVLASDEFEGRAPGTRGEELTIDYIAKQFGEVGLAPAGADGGYLQPVPLTAITPRPDMALRFNVGGSTSTLKFRDDFVAWTKRFQPRVTVEGAELVFAGYGVQAPEFGWDDFKGVDLRGKALVVLVGDPPVPDPKNPEALDPAVFEGRAMTYYGRWTYKYEMGARLGAAAVLIVHETEPAGYPFAVVQGKTGEQLDLATPDRGAGRVAVEGWITLEQAKRLFAAAGQDYETLKRAACSRDFRPLPLDGTMSVAIDNSLREVTSHNVVGRLAGRDKNARDEAVVFVAHWDHFGIGPEVNGDRIYHGALDNASGVAGMIELARAYASLATKPRRSLIFVSVTAEEQNLLGSQYYVEHPVVPLARTAAMINLDAVNVLGRTRDVSAVGLGRSGIDEVVRRLAAEQGRTVVPDPQPEKGSFFRSDHFPFAAAGVPFVDLGSGVDYVGRPPGWGLKMRDEYTAKHYHKPSDTVRPEWNLEGAVEDLQLLWRIGFTVAESKAMPARKAVGRQ